MMYDLGIAWRNIRNRPVETFVPILVVALAIALSVSVITLADGGEKGIIQASDPFGMIVVGSSGSGQQLVLSSVLLQGNPIGNIPYSVYEELEADDARVRLAVPLAFGDNVGGKRIIGTNQNFFEIRRTQLDPPAFQIAEGRLFNDYSLSGDDFQAEAVLGSQAARDLDLTIGDQFFGAHGVSSSIAENVHENLRYTVVGILESSRSAYDQAVYTQIRSVWDAHADTQHQAGSEDDASAGDLPSAGRTTLTTEVGAAPLRNEVTTVLVLPTGFIEQNQIAQEFYLDPTLQAAFPGQELGNLINLLNQGQQLLNIIGYLVLGIAALTLFLSMYSAVLARQQSIAIMRGLGSSRNNIFRVIIFETLIVSILGALLGRVIGYALAAVIGTVYSAQSAIPVPIAFQADLESVLWVLSIGVGVLAGVVPALLAYRVDVVENLFPS